MGWYEVVGRRLFFSLDPERAHAVALRLLGLPLPWARIGGAVADPALRTTVCGIPVVNPFGLAAGFDKSCARLTQLGELGFGYVVGGTLTRAPRAANPRPRCARSPARGALVNAMGLPNPGAAAATAHLVANRRTAPRWVSLADEAVADVVAAFDLVAPHADAIELNASSPNAGWSHRATHVGEVVRELVARARVPISVKVPPPDPSDDRGTVFAIAAAAQAAGAAAITCANTVPVRDPRLSTGRGGLSGLPLRERTPAHIRALRSATGGELEVHASGGVFDADDAWACLEAGAASVQVYTGMIFRGPAIVGALTRGLAARLRSAGLVLSDLAGSASSPHAS
jgi:dihydroorotate dehydrogenase